MKKILGLDLGTNSIGWALIEQDFANKQGKILGMGSRIIPMSQDILGEFDKGNSVSQTAERTGFRSIRRLRERHLLRRERLHRILRVLGFLPKHYENQIDFVDRLGKFLNETEPKLAYHENDFLFKNSFQEMLENFNQLQPKLLKEGKKVPYDWTIYYLRKKAVTQRIEKEELAWILLNFNQKRGYYQLRGEEGEENMNKLVEFHSLKVIEVLPDEKPNNKGETWYSLRLENGWVYRRSSKTPLFDWKDKVRDFIVTADLNDDGSIKTDKEGNEKRSFRAPSEDDWALIKKKTEQEIGQSNKTVGTYVYDTLLQNPKQKIKGKLIRTIERKFYKDELKTILKVQKRFHPELQNEELYHDCVRELYRNNEAHKSALSNKNIEHLIVEDIIFYQRPLRSQKSTIGNCSLEFKKYKLNGEEKTGHLKIIPKSHPLYQEFRVWQWLYNLKIYKKDDDTDVTHQFLDSIEAFENLYEFLMAKKEVDHKDILKLLFASHELKGKELNLEIAKYRWNYVYDSEKDESKKYPCNETGHEIRRRLAKVENIAADFITPEIEVNLWHIIYSVTDKKEYEKALGSFAVKHKLNKISFVDNFKSFPPFKSEYGTFSEKAIKKLLVLIRSGKYWSWDAIDIRTKERIDKIITGEYGEDIKIRVREKAIHLTTEHHFQGLQLWLASYVVYGRHSEADIAEKWDSVTELDGFLQEFRQHSLRNPIVEQVVIETLRVVKDIWMKYGNGMNNFFSEIHVELGREMKNTAEERNKITNQISQNENTNLRVKALLAEMLHDINVENVRPYSPTQQEALKIYEDGVLHSNIDVPDDILKISKTAQPTKLELLRYKLWLEQKYQSPYTGKVIPLNKLFTSEYEIEHVIPQSRYFDDSFSNKVICESAVNKLKDKQLGLEFIKSHHGERVSLGFGREVDILSVEAYKSFITEHYAKNKSKKNKLLLEDIPEKMIERQLNDTRYISKFISSILSNIVREGANDDGVNSKNVLPGNGKITSSLKQDWGLNDVWNDLILPRFERINQITGSSSFTDWNENHQKFLPIVPLELSKGFQKKRIDHRHHALDALIIACATRDHINYMNNEYASSKIYKTKEDRQNKRYDLRNNLCYKKYNNDSKENFRWIFYQPWDNFKVESKTNIERIIVSFKQNIRVINKTTNYFESYKHENGALRIGKDSKPKKDLISQTKGDSWAIRKPMHKATVSGLIKLRKKKTVSLGVALENYLALVDKKLKRKVISLVKLKYDKILLSKFFKDSNFKWEGNDISKVEIYYWEEDQVASRVSLDTTFNEKKIESITDTGIQKILLNHLSNYKGILNEKGKEVEPETLAFTSEGIEEINKNIASLNNGKSHQSIQKVRTYEPKGNKFNVGQTGNKGTKYVEAAQGTNLFFAIYQNVQGKRSYETVPLNLVIERQKLGLSPVPEINEKEDNLLFYLSPNDFVYVPTEEEKDYLHEYDFKYVTKEHVSRIYKFTDGSDTTGNFIPAFVSDLLFNISKKEQERRGLHFPIQNEYGLGSPQSKNQRSVDGLMIKECCIKLKIDRLGNVYKA